MEPLAYNLPIYTSLFASENKTLGESVMVLFNIKVTIQVAVYMEAISPQKLETRG